MDAATPQPGNLTLQPNLRPRSLPPPPRFLTFSDRAPIHRGRALPHRRRTHPRSRCHRREAQLRSAARHTPRRHSRKNSFAASSSLISRSPRPALLAANPHGSNSSPASARHCGRPPSPSPAHPHSAKTSPTRSTPSSSASPNAPANAALRSPATPAAAHSWAGCAPRSPSATSTTTAAPGANPHSPNPARATNPPPPHHSHAAEPAQLTRLTHSLQQVLPQLSPEDRFLLASYFLDQHTLLEIARLLRVSRSHHQPQTQAPHHGHPQTAPQTTTDRRPQPPRRRRSHVHRSSRSHPQPANSAAKFATSPVPSTAREQAPRSPAPEPERLPTRPAPLARPAQRVRRERAARARAPRRARAHVCLRGLPAGRLPRAAGRPCSSPPLLLPKLHAAAGSRCRKSSGGRHCCFRLQPHPRAHRPSSSQSRSGHNANHHRANSSSAANSITITHTSGARAGASHQSHTRHTLSALPHRRSLRWLQIAPVPQSIRGVGAGMATGVAHENKMAAPSAQITESFADNATSFDTLAQAPKKSPAVVAGAMPMPAPPPPPPTPTQLGARMRQDSTAAAAPTTSVDTNSMAETINATSIQDLPIESRNATTLYHTCTRRYAIHSGCPAKSLSPQHSTPPDAPSHSIQMALSSLAGTTANTGAPSPRNGQAKLYN